MGEWPYPHAARGTCVPGCPLYGYCHCRCGDRTTIADQNRRASPRFGAWVRGRPMIHRCGHSGHGGCWVRQGIPIETAQAMLRYLRRYHSWDEISRGVGASKDTLQFYIYGRRGTMAAPSVARAIATFVLWTRENFQEKRWSVVDTFDRDVPRRYIEEVA